MSDDKAKVSEGKTLTEPDASQMWYDPSNYPRSVRVFKVVTLVGTGFVAGWFFGRRASD